MIQLPHGPDQRGGARGGRRGPPADRRVDPRGALGEAEQAARDAAEARRDAEAAIADLKEELGQKRSRTRVTKVGIGDFLMQFSVFWVLASALLKIVYKGRLQAEVKAAQATETAESESLKRQVVEARMAAMQAQVEPHFLFNTLASIDHLIETDPPRASLMQKNLIALLRASMPSMREVNSPGSASTRDLGRELAVIRPYLEILKVRMEERLATEIRVSDGLLSADFPPMMLQSLVENAIKHGLEPKAEGWTAERVGRDRARQARGDGGRHRPRLRQGGHRRHRHRPVEHPGAAAAALRQPRQPEGGREPGWRHDGDDHRALSIALGRGAGRMRESARSPHCARFGFACHASSARIWP